MCNQASFKKGETPLDYALLVGQAESVKFLLSKGANPNSLRESQIFPTLQVNSLSSCLGSPNVRMVRLLLPHMDPTSFVCASNGMNLLHLACAYVYEGAES